METSPFSTSTAFCAKCGSILPLLQQFGSVKCYSCKAVYKPESKFVLYLQYFSKKLMMSCIAKIKVCS